MLLAGGGVRERTYIFYAGPEYSINAKLKAVALDFNGNIRAVSIMAFGPIYFVDMKPEAGTVNFTEMV